MLREIHEYTIYDASNPLHKWSRSVTVQATELVYANDDDFIGNDVEVTVTVLACSICGNPAQPMHRADDAPSVCGRDCAKVEDELCDAASEAYYRREF